VLAVQQQCGEKGKEGEEGGITVKNKREEGKREETVEKER
jgi:hypothetical protein